MKKYEDGRYIDMTQEEIESVMQGFSPDETPTTEERLAALEAAMLEQLLGVMDMFKFLKIQYKLGKVTDEQLQSLVGKVITKEQYALIIEAVKNHVS